MDNLQPHALKEKETLPDFTSCSYHLSHADSHFWTTSSFACRFQDLGPFQPDRFQYPFQYRQSLFLHVRTDPLQLGRPGGPTSEVWPFTVPV